MKSRWETKKLEDLAADIPYPIGDGDHGQIKPSFYTDSGIPYIRVGDIGWGVFKPDNMVFISEKIHQKNLKSELRPNDILLAKTGATIGKCCIVPNSITRANTTSSVGKVTVDKNKVLPKWVLYWFLSPEFYKYMWSISNRAAQPGFNNRDIKQFKIPLPPLEEQKRIVIKLDEAFAGLAKAKENTEKNVQNARALFESHLETVFTQRGPGWVQTTLSRATDGVFTGPFGSLLHKSDYITDGIPLVNPAHITEVGIEPDPCKTVSKSTALRLKSYILRKGDIVIGRRGEMGRCALVTEVEDGWLCGTGSFFIKPSSQCDTRYLVRFLRSDSCKARLEKIAGGAVMPNLSNAGLGDLTLDLPPLDRQKAIVKEIDSLHEETQHLARLYDQKRKALESLKKSILHEAFSGNL